LGNSGYFVYDISSPAEIVTDSGQGDFIISGTEKLVVSTVNGLDISGGITQTKSVNGVIETAVAEQVIQSSGKSAVDPTVTYGQSFSPNATGTLKKVTVAIGNSGTSTGDIALELYTVDGSGFPNALLETSATIDISTLGWFPVADTVFTFANTTILTSGVDYVIVHKITNTPTGGLNYRISLANEYTSGRLIETTDSGSTWHNALVNDDLYFIVATDVAAVLPNIEMHGVTSGTLGLFASAVTTDYLLTLPAAQSTANQVMSNDGTGNLSWVDNDPLRVITSYSAAQTLVIGTDDIVKVTGTTTITLPAVSGNSGVSFAIKNMDAALTTTIQADGAELIDGSNTQTLTTQYASVTVICDGTAWIIVQ